MEVCFVDVAQGSASVVLLGNGRAIVIDCGGRQARTVVSLLSHYRISTICRLVVTHNHADHSAGAVAILSAYQQRIEEVWMVFDTVLERSIFWARIQEELSAGRLTDNQIFRLEYRNEATQIYRKDGILLSVIAPSMAANVRALYAGNPNATSGVLVLKGHNKQVIFSGDSTISQWQRIHNLRGRSIKCLLATIPHHAGKTWENQMTTENGATYAARIASELKWFYTEAVQADVGVVSTGTSNTFKHPRPEVLVAFRLSGGKIFCTQMTKQCDPDLEGQRRRALPIVLPSRSSSQPQKTRKGASSNVACGGTLRVVFLPDSATIVRLQDHAATVDRVPLIAGQGPLCRRL